MRNNSISRPSPDEYAPFYASYIERVPKNAELIPAMSLAGFDENLYAATSGANARPIERLLSEFALVRAGSLALLDSFLDDSVYLECGEVSGANVSVRALAYIIAGHELHHLAVLRERYLR
jgi:hypothetical protein